MSSPRASSPLIPFIPLSLLIGCAPAYISRKPPAPEPLVRVAIGHGLPSIVIEAKDTVWATDGRHASPIAPDNSWTVTVRQGRLEVRTSTGTVINEIGQKLSFRGRSWLSWNKQPLAWPLTIAPENDSALLAVVELPLEKYLVGVLTKEMGNAAEAELEALKAQAVAARSYAYVKIGSRPGAAYDLESDVSHQAFDTGGGESPAIRKAVEKTRGQVLACRGKPFAPNYHSTCGGRTAMPSEVWGTPDSLFPWAKSVKCEHCRISPRFRWKATLASGELARRALGLADTTIPIYDVRIEENSPSGRVKGIRICSQAGDTVLYRDCIRFQIADRPLPSTWFVVKCRRDDLGNVDSVEFTGQGFGHGVGLCQWGAMGMAREGRGYKKMLSHYFPDVELIKLY